MHFISISHFNYNLSISILNPIKDAGHEAVSEVFSEAVKAAMKAGDFNKVGTLIDIAEKCGIDVKVNPTNNRTTKRYGR